jgi:cysteine desulfurase
MTIYLDHHATTPLDPRVLDAMLPFLKEEFGNASSRHAIGRRAAEAVERARVEVAGLAGAEDEEEIVFTSGATESNNLVIKGVAEAYRGTRDHVVTVATEHVCVLESCRTLERRGMRVTVLPVDGDGLVDLERLRKAVGDRTILVSVMAANNEIGVLQDVDAIGRFCRERGVLFHTDAAQAAGKVPFRVDTVDFASFSAHKVYGPKGVGAVYARKRHPVLKRIRCVPLLDGGAHERGLRSGTLNVAGIVGMGAAFAIARGERETEAARLLALRERLWRRIAALGDVRLNGHASRRLPGNLNVSIEQVEGESLMQALGDVAISSGAACSSAKLEPSHVLKALGLPEHLLFSSFRFGLGRFTSDAEIDTVVNRLEAAVARLRAASPLRPGRK